LPVHVIMRIAVITGVKHRPVKQNVMVFRISPPLPPPLTTTTTTIPTHPPSSHLPRNFSKTASGLVPPPSPNTVSLKRSPTSRTFSSLSTPTYRAVEVWYDESLVSNSTYKHYQWLWQRQWAAAAAAVSHTSWNASKASAAIILAHSYP